MWKWMMRIVIFFVGGHHDGRVTMMHLEKDGSIGAIADGIFHIGMARGSDRRTNTPHVDCVKLTPDQKFCVQLITD